MFKNIKNKITSGALYLFIFFMSGESVFAQVVNNPDDSGGFDVINEPVSLQNPLGSTDTIWELVSIVIGIVQTIMIPIVVLFIIYSGFLFVTAQGNETKLTKAKQVIMYTIIGAAIIIGAEAIQMLIEGTVDQLKTGL